MMRIPVGVSALILGVALGLPGCGEDNEKNAAAQQPTTGEVPTAAQPKSLEDFYKQQQANQKGLPGAAKKLGSPSGAPPK